MSVIVDIDFEAGNLNEWTSTSGGDLSASASAALAGTAYGMAVLIDDTTADYGRVGSLNSTSGKLRYRVYFDPNGLTIGSGTRFGLFYLYNTAGDHLCALRFEYKSATDYYLRLNLYDDAGNASTSRYATITDGPHYVEVYAQRSSGSTANDGSASWWLDGTAQTGITGVDNYDRWAQVDKLDAGAGIVDAVDAGTSGTLYIDQIVANDDGGAIGGKTYQSASGEVSLSGSPARGVSKIIAGALSSAGSLLTQLTGGANNYTQTIGGALTSAGGMLKRAARALAGGIVPANLTTFGRQAQTSAGGSVSSAGATTRQTRRILAGVAGSAGVLARRSSRALAGALDWAGSIVSQLNAGAQQFAQTVGGALAASGALARRTARALAGGMASAGETVKRTGRALAGALSSAGALTTLRAFLRAAGGALAAAGGLTRQAHKALSGSAASTGSLYRLAARTLEGGLASAGAAARRTARTLTGALSWIGSIASTAGQTSPTPAGRILKVFADWRRHRVSKEERNDTP